MRVAFLKSPIGGILGLEIAFHGRASHTAAARATIRDYGLAPVAADLGDGRVRVDVTATSGGQKVLGRAQAVVAL